MNEIEFRYAAQFTIEERAKTAFRQVELEGGEAVDGKARVVEIRRSLPITKTTFRVLLGEDEITDQLTGFLSKDRRRKPGDLQHFET